MITQNEKHQPPGNLPEQKPVKLPAAFYRTLIAIAQANALDKARAVQQAQAQLQEASVHSHSHQP